MRARQAVLLISKYLTAAAVLMAWSGVSKAAVLYQITVNTSSLSGTAGNIDFQFNPGGGSTQAGSVAISSFTGGTIMGAASTLGSVSGSLPSTVTINNSGAFNDYFHAFTFGNSFSFTLRFSGPAVDAPNGIATSGSAFGLSLYNAAGDVPLLTNNPDGFIASANLNLNGTVTTSTYPSSSTGGAPVASLLLIAIPEPATQILLGASLLAIGGLALRRRR